MANAIRLARPEGPSVVGNMVGMVINPVLMVLNPVLMIWNQEKPVLKPSPPCAGALSTNFQLQILAENNNKHAFILSDFNEILLKTHLSSLHDTYHDIYHICWFCIVNESYLILLISTQPYNIPICMQHIIYVAVIGSFCATKVWTQTPGRQTDRQMTDDIWTDIQPDFMIRLARWSTE